MKNAFEVEEVSLAELLPAELVNIEGGAEPITLAGAAALVAIGVATYLIAEDWANIKKGAHDGFKAGYSN